CSEYGNDDVFRKLVDEINYLQDNGLSFKLNGEEIMIYFAIGLFMANNLGLNSAMGYVESFRGTYFCRLCKAKLKDTHHDCYERKHLLRKKEEYEEDLEKGMYQSGLKEYSIWNEIKYFHIFDDFYMDVFHDFNEEGLKYDMSHVLYHYLFEIDNPISLEFLNTRLRTFNYKLNGISNKPPLITIDEAKKSICRCPEVRSTNVQIECCALLDKLVAEHHQLYIKLFKDTLKPKHHNMVHYGRIMSMSGPIRELSTIRCEANHRHLKVSAYATNSRRNITHTLALKEQLNFCYRLISKRGLVSELEMGPSSLVNNVSELESIYTTNFPYDFNSSCIEVPWIKWQGIEYRRGTCVVLSSDFDNGFTF
ncbi:uncharacterized protein LOC117182573, partial [Belonocnema kinseyi]|uniref:uncharacterized protein LOC117182573 n=1 Tax=Belonocnema kinseyi TaxID=2817044 RepID=UPI00143D3186